MIFAALSLQWRALSFFPKVNYPRPSIPVNVTLNLTPGALGIESSSVSAVDLRFIRLSSIAQLNPQTLNPSLTKAIRYALIPSFLIVCLVSWLICTLLRNICARVEQGEVFSDANLRAIRNVGLTLLISPLCNGALELWSRLWLNSYLATEVKVTGIAATLQFGNWDFNLFIKDLVTGLLVLLIAEAFREGLALKKENDLTV